MLFKKINVANAISINRAITLIEVLIALTIGVTLLFIFVKLNSDFYYTQYKQRELINLQKHSHQLLDYFQQHIQHIGYQGEIRKNSNFHLFYQRNKPYFYLEPHCIIFLEDNNGDGCLGKRNKKQPCSSNDLNMTGELAKEIFGFKLENKVIFVFDDDKNIRHCYRRNCLTLLENCNRGKWARVSELSDYQVEDLVFSWIKENQLIKITLTLSSVKDPKVEYQAAAYSYLFNGRE